MKTKKFFNDAEKVILENLPREFKYIARDESGIVSVFKQRPTKTERLWMPPAGTEFYSLPMFSHLFEDVEWENRVPCNFRNMLEV